MSTQVAPAPRHSALNPTRAVLPCVPAPLTLVTSAPQHSPVHNIKEPHHNYWRRWCFYWSSTLRTMSYTLANTAVTVVCAWVAAMCFRSGNMFSNLEPQQQSRRTFLMGTLLWANVLFCCVVWITRSMPLFGLELLSHPGHRAGVVRSLTRTFQKTFVWFLVCAAMVSGIGYGCGSLNESWRKYKVELYSSCLWFYSYVVVAEHAARRVYRHETVQGRDRQQQKTTNRRGAAGDVPPYSIVRQFGRHLWTKKSLLVSLFVPTLYVHLITIMGVATSTRRVWWFTAASLVLKIAMQEVAKHHILRAKIQNPRTMVTIVAVPTVLIDTQVRILFLRFQSVQVTLSTTVAMAVAEICIRICKTILIQWELHRHRHRRRVSPTPSMTTTHGTKFVSDVDTDRDYAALEAQLHHYHTTEVIADMYAEYIAIGCSSMITVVLGHDPHFLLGAASSSSTPLVSPLWQLLAQVVVEALVDFVSCFLEIARGLTFADADRDRGFYLVLFVLLAVVNMSLSAILYLA